MKLVNFMKSIVFLSAVENIFEPMQEE